MLFTSCLSFSKWAEGGGGGGGDAGILEGGGAGLSNMNNNEGEGCVVQTLLETRTWWHWF